MRKVVVVALLAVCLWFTGVRSALADEALTPARWGSSLRIGSVVGTTALGGERLTALGVQAALGYKMGPIAVEAEVETGELLQKKSYPYENDHRGDFSRLGVNARWFFGRLGKRFEPDSLLLLYAELGAGRQFGQLQTRDEFSRTETSVGAGWVLDHRSKLGGKFNYIGWQFGWRMTASRKASQTPTALVVCKSKPGGCPPMEFGSGADLGLIVSSSISFSW